MKVNANLLEISQWQYKLTSAGASVTKFPMAMYSSHIQVQVDPTFHSSKGRSCGDGIHFAND